MKKSVLILFVLVYLMTYTDMGQLLKLPTLISHYFQHQNQNKNVDFIDFIAMHYGGGDDGNTKDDDIDKQFPFHNYEYNSSLIVFATMTKSAVYDRLVYFFQNKFINREINPKTVKHSRKIIRPPKEELYL